MWATTEHGARIPVDPDPRPDGNLELVRLQSSVDVLTARVLTDERREEIALSIMTANRLMQTLPLNLYVSHFATCPASEMFGRRAQTNGGVTAWPSHN